MNILQLLADKKIIGKGDIAKLEKQAAAMGKSAEAAAEAAGVPTDAILSAKSEYYNLPAENLEGHDVPFAVLKYVSEDAATHYQFVPISFEDGVLGIGILDPENIEARDAISFIVGKLNVPYKLYVISEKDFKKTLESYRGLSGEVKKALTDLESELTSDLKEVKKEEKAQAAPTITEEAPVTKIVATILHYATEGNASDVHIEPMADKVRVRFRVDGVLNTSLVLPAEVESAVTARIKILANMRLDEKRKPQDGRFSANIEGRKIDFRVSTFPTYYGEKIVMRILDQARGVKKLDDMGFSPRYLAMVREAMKRPYGLILISGPTGSGKTTTLYAMLNEMDKEHKNVLSLEDPIEYNIAGISQSQVFPEIGYDFANGLRTTLRQDPNVIMVGEIRDKETAGLAIQAALTGHLVLSTIHTNTACGVIPRLIDMDVDPYLIAPTLILAMGQRLVDQLCPGTGTAIPMTESMDAMIEKEFADLPAEFRKEVPKAETFYEKESTPQCPTGVKGRMAVFEMFKMTGDIEETIMKNPNEPDVFKAARKSGLITMKEDAIIKAMQRVIPFEAINQL
ncbi:MAG: type II/IV secretion system protein [Patescibacteria group bacterium]|nr:GspE/PulE family protein [Patescibacteria group bacterium]MDE1945627.1 type II/IV secretion system protein [Patescibacteria group bacterium]